MVKYYEMVFADGAVSLECFQDDRLAVMSARRHNEMAGSGLMVVDVRHRGKSILCRPWRSSMGRISELIRKNGFALKTLKNCYLVESTDRALLEIVPKLKATVAEDIGGYVLEDSVTLDARKNVVLYRVLIN